jgi:anthranilate phosphoribosyltransferase
MVFVMKNTLERLLDGAALPPAEIDALFDQMFAGALTEAELAAVLAAWRIKGETAAELTAGARAMRKQAATTPIGKGARPLIDNCGTGGDGAHSFNISTASAVVAAAAGARVAKHGNRSVSSKCGSADLLFELGFPADLKPEAAAKLLDQTGFTFFFAPTFHSAMRHVAPVRKALGVRTIFNLLGPLANPIAPEHQVLGVGAKRFVRPMAEALAALGIKSALVVHSRDGLDEISPAAATDAILIEGGHLRDMVIEPAAYRIKASLADLAGGDAAVNAKIMHELLGGKTGAVCDAVALNAGAVLWLFGKAADLGAGVTLAASTLAGGKAKTYFSTWIAAAQSLRGAP